MDTSADQNAYARRMAQALMQQGSSAEPVQHWTQGAARLAQAMVGGMYGDQARQGDAALRQQQLAKEAEDRKYQENALSRQAQSRAALAQQYGMQPGTPQHQAFALSGNLQDPLEAEYKRAQIEKLRRPDMGADTPQGRAAAAAQYGLDPNSDAGRSFILTGKLPREDQQTLTATDKKAILEADEMVSSNRAGLDGLNRALSLSSKAYDGATANERAWITSQFGSDAGIATREFNQALIQQALPQLKAIFGGNPTEGERNILLQIQGSAEMPQKARESIIKEAMRLAQKRLEFNQQRADQLRGGTFYKPQGAAPSPGAPVPQRMDLGDGFSLEVSP